jgi:hypothetical protein
MGWATGLGAVLSGVASLAYPDHVGAVDTLWAILALLWAGALVVLTDVEVRRVPALPEPG